MGSLRSPGSRNLCRQPLEPFQFLRVRRDRHAGAARRGKHEDPRPPDVLDLDAVIDGSSWLSQVRPIRLEADEYHQAWLVGIHQFADALAGVEKLRLGDRK